MLDLAKFLKLPEAIVKLLEGNLIPYTVLLAVCGVVLAFWGYRFVKIALIIGSAAGAGVATNLFLVPLFADKVSDVWIISVTGIAIVAAAAIGAVIAFKAPRFIIFCGGAACGYFLVGPYVRDFAIKTFSKVEFLAGDIAKIAIFALTALILAIIVSVFFKFLFITGTAFAGAGVTVTAVFSLALTKSLASLAIPCIAISAALAIAGIIYQYIRSDRTNLLYY